MIEALLAHRHVAHADLVAGLEAAGSAGALSADAVKITTRRLADAPTVQNWRILARCAGPGTGHEPGYTSRLRAIAKNLAEPLNFHVTRGLYPVCAAGPRRAARGKESEVPPNGAHRA